MKSEGDAAVFAVLIAVTITRIQNIVDVVSIERDET
jgi:hypothetical protein